MFISLKAVYRFKAIPIKILMAFFIDIEKSPQICVEPQRTLNSQSNPDKEEQSWRYHTSSMQNTLPKAIEIKTYSSRIKIDTDQ